MSEGFASFVYGGETYQTYYKIFGDLALPNAIPVIVIHGGPGMTHDYLLPHADLALSRSVILYDQIGNGRSTLLPDKPRTFWTIDLFLDEFTSLITHLGIQSAFHVIGHSWGGMMASELVVRRHPAGLKQLVIADSPASIALWRASFGELLQEFPQEVRDTLARGENADLVAYRTAVRQVYAVYGLRLQPFPEEFETTLRYRYGDDADRTVANAGCVKLGCQPSRYSYS